MYSDIRLACWLSDKKSQKTNWIEFENICKQNGIQLFKLDLNESLETQGPFTVLLHKLTDVIVSAQIGDIKSLNILNNIENYISKRPKLVVIDPIPKVRQLLDRYKCYNIIDKSSLHKNGVFIPKFCKITSNNIDKTTEQLKEAHVSYPFICKPQLGHGSKEAHQMLLIFNQDDLKLCKASSVAQNFVNHNAVLYKIFIVGKKYYYVERPSLKNFYAGEADAIFFDSSDVSKAGSQSKLSVLDPEDESNLKQSPNPEIFLNIADVLRLSFGMNLLGVDVVIENNTQKYAIIDVNAYPGYDGFPNFYDALIDCIKEKVTNISNKDLL